MKLPDDADELEVELFNLLVNNIYEPKSTSYIYSLLSDPMDKFLACFIFELGNTRKSAESACGLSKATIWSRIKRIKKQILPYATKNCLVDLNLMDEDEIN